MFVARNIFRLKDLKDHLTAHTTERNCTCDTCGKSFRPSKPYKEQMNVHQGNKSHKCNVCSYILALKKNLNVHVMRHSHNLDTLYYPERKLFYFYCNECDQIFSSSQLSKAHLKLYHKRQQKD